jgi:hypothetical protein
MCLIYRVYLKWLEKLQERFPCTKTRKQVHMNICPLTVTFLGAAQQCADLRPVNFICIQLQLEMKRHFTDALLMVVI